MPYSLAEEPRDMARRHVLQAERLVVHQTALVARLRNRGCFDLAAKADSLLDTLTISLSLARDHATRLEGHNRTRVRDLAPRRIAHGSSQVA
jgi:hypothetical protein